MSELGSGSGTSYPTSLDNDNIQEGNTPTANRTRARAEVANDLAAAIIAIETELGTGPKGTAANVKTFLQTQHNLDGSHKSISTNTLSATGQITSTVVTGTAPLIVASTTEVANLKSSTSVRLTDGANLIKTKIIDIGDWNMVSTAGVNVAHGLTLSKIRFVYAHIRDDGGVYLQPPGLNNYGLFQINYVDSTNVNIGRIGSSTVDYDATSYNRGWVTIWYIE